MPPKAAPIQINAVYMPMVGIKAVVPNGLANRFEAAWHTRLAAV